MYFRAVVSDYHKLGGLKQDIYSFTVLGPRCLAQTPGPLTAVGENLPLPLPASGGSRCSLACGHFTAFSASLVTLPPPRRCVGVVSSCLSLTRTLVIAFGALLDNPG